MREDRLAGSRLVFDVEPFSSGDGNAQGQVGGLDEMVVGHLRGAVHPEAQVVRPFVRRTLQGVDSGWERQWIFTNGLRLCAFESGAGEAAEPGSEAARLSVEQLWGVSPATWPARRMAASGATAGGDGNSERQCGGTKGI